MKRKSSIAFSLVFVLLAACGQHNDNGSVETRHGTSLQPTASPALSAIDSLMWQQPDSALVLLQDYFACRDAMLASPDTVDSNLRRPDAVDSNLRRIQCVSTTFDRHYAHLLLSELLYKNDYAQTNRAELQQAVAYYDSLCRCTDVARNVSTDPAIVFLDARAHYINGVGYYERDSVVEACAEYLKALETMEGHFDEDEMVGKKAKFMALAYTHLTGLLSDQFLLEQAIYFGEFSLHYYYKHDAPNWHIAWMLVEVGSLYDMMEQLDSAASYYNQAMRIITDTLGLTYRDIVAHQAFLKYKKDGQKKDALSRLHYVLTKAESNEEISARNLPIAEIYYYEEEYDSAKVFYNSVFDETENSNSKFLSAQRLHEIYVISGDTINSNRFALYLSQFANVGDERGKLHSQLTKLCKEYEQKKQENLHRQSARKARLASIGVALGLLVIITLLYVVSKKRGRRLLKEKAKAEDQLKTECHAYKTQQAALAGRLKKSNESLREVSQQLEDIKASMSLASDKMESQPDLSAFMGSPVCIHILKIVEDRNFKPKTDYMIYKEYALDKKQLMTLMEAADTHLGRFTVRLRKQYPALTNDDMKYCCLYLLGLNEADISALMQRAYSTVCERNRKIKRIIGTEDELPVALKELV